MNHYNAFPQPVSGGGFHLMLRFCRDGKTRPLMEAPDKPAHFPTREEALEACRTHLLKFLNGHEYRGERFDGKAARDEAEKLFSTRRSA